MTLPNMNPLTGIPYGCVSANDLDPEMVEVLLYQNSNTKNISFINYMAYVFGVEAAEAYAANNLDQLEDSTAEAMTLHAANYEAEEEEICGVYDEVHYQSFFLGGALHFFITKSPWVTQQAQRASPCLPNAGILPPLCQGLTKCCYTIPWDWYNHEIVARTAHSFLPNTPEFFEVFKINGCYVTVITEEIGFVDDTLLDAMAGLSILIGNQEVYHAS